MSTTVLAKPDYDVLNVVALKKMATANAIGVVCRRDPDAVDRTLGELAGRGMIVVAGAAALPTDEAEPALAASAAEYYAAVRDDPDILDLVDRFDDTNRRFLATMSAWQQVDVGGRTVANDHTDAEYDDRVITRIDRLVQRLGPLLAGLSTYDRCFEVYGERFEVAMRGADSGQRDLISSPMHDSVHNIWFEFHEDLLRTLGRERKE